MWDSRPRLSRRAQPGSVLRKPEAGLQSPVPVRLTFCGLWKSLSAMLKVPVRAPVAVGVNVMLTMQLAAGASGLTQVLVWAKSPVMATAPTFSGVPVVLVSVNFSGELVVPTFCVAKVSDVSDRLTPVAVPFNVSVCGLAGSLLRMFTPPSTVPEVLGEKVTATVQLLPAARLVPQVLVWANSPTTWI